MHTVFTVHQKHAIIHYLLLCMIVRLLLKCYALGKAQMVLLVTSFSIASLRSTSYMRKLLDKRCWVFHPSDFKGFPRVHLVSYVIELLMRLTYVVIVY